MTESLQSATLNLERISNPDSQIDATLRLPEGGISLYLLDLKALAAAEAKWAELLSPDEQQRAARFHFARDRQRYCAARALLRSLLGAYLGASPHDVAFEYSDKGKPTLASRQHSGLAFNVSHSGDLAMLGFTVRNKIGVDIEEIRNDFDTTAIARRFFSAAEQNQLSCLPADQRHEAFFHCWTRKEAFIKALGEGLSHPLDQFDVSLDPLGPVSLCTRPDPDEAENWWLRSVAVGSGYAAAFAVSRF